MASTAKEKVQKALAARKGMLVRSMAMEKFMDSARSGAMTTSLISEMPRNVAREIVAKNVSLIKTIDAELFPEITRRIVRVLKGLDTRDELEDWLENKGEVSPERAALIADDQIKKATEAFQLARWMRNGFTKVMWKHGNSKEYRVYHKTKWDGHKGKRNGKPNGLNGYVFDISKPPVIDTKTGERGYPGQCIGCRCFLVPIQ